MKYLFVAMTILSVFCGKVRADEISTNSVYNLESKWINQDGLELQLRSYKGHRVIIAMVYLTCKFLCPTIISDVQKIESKLSAKSKEDVRIILVSFDPNRDTTKAMKAYAKKRKLDLKRWSLISQKDESNIRELAAVLGFKYQKQEGGTEYSHSFQITALDKEGVIKAQIDGANKDPGEFVQEIEKMQK